MNKMLTKDRVAEISKTIFSYCMSKTPTREEAEDLSQDILYELIRSSENLRDDKAFYGFMWAVAGNVYKQWCRKKAKRNTCELNENIPTPEDGLDLDDQSDIYLLRRELTLLSKKYRRATILYYIDGQSCAQIAASLDISESMVKYLLFKSRKILKEGMTMERKLGSLSYNPKNLVPLYHGSGPNLFGSFMQSKVRQNIVNACYNDALTAEQISLEIGIPLPYLDDEITALEDKKLLLRDGPRYKANVVIITSDCADEIGRRAAAYHDKIAAQIRTFLDTRLADFKRIGFVGADFTDNSLRWQLLTFVLSAITLYDTDVFEKNDASEFPQTAWGDHAYLWMVEKNHTINHYIFNFSQEQDRQGDRIHFFDYLPTPKGDHRDFYGNTRYVNILCDIARGRCNNLSEYDLEAVADMIRKGYIVKDSGTYRVTMPLFTAAQYAETIALVKEFVETELSGILQELDRSSAAVLSEHTPRHLQPQVNGISGMDKYVNAACIPAERLVNSHYLHTDWHPLEMPTTFIVLST